MPSQIRKKSEGKRKNPFAEAVFPMPFCRLYFQSAGYDLQSTKMLCAVSLLAAMCAVLDVFYIPVGGAFLRIQFSFFAAAILGLVGGPYYALGGGFVVDLLSFLLSGGDPAGYFPGYALSSMLAFLIYALFFYHARLSFARIFLCRLTVDVGINVILGSLWKQMLYGKAYTVYFISGAVKNLTLLPLEAVLLTLLLRRLLPLLHRLGLSPAAEPVAVSKRDIVLSAAGAVAGVLLLYVYYVYKTKQ